METTDGVIVQLPFFSHIDLETVLATLNSQWDVDGLGHTPLVLPPVVVAIDEICRRENIDFSGKAILVAGYGRLVGKPISQWLTSKGLSPSVVTSPEELQGQAPHADVIFLGTGVPHLLKPSMIKEGVIIMDAGTSEDAGKVVGDADPVCAEKASLFTPVPGGIGPITVSAIFKNLFYLMKRKTQGVR